MRILFVGDVFGNTGLEYALEMIPELIVEYNVDFCVVNGENVTRGRGIGQHETDELLACGADCITMGNHTWNNHEIYSFIDDLPIIRPANHAPDLPGRGSIIIEKGTQRLGIINLQGRAFMDPCDNPFIEADRQIEAIAAEAKHIIIDFHAEASAEKAALAYYVRGRVSAVIGTHTHVQTADERIDGGTAFITDVGMTGPRESIIGMERKNVINRFVRSVPVRFEPAGGSPMLCAVVVETDEAGRAVDIERIAYFGGK